MKPHHRLLLRLLALLGVAALPCQAALNVVATLPDFGSLAQAVGGPDVQVTSLAKGTEDAHFVDPRPSFIRVLNRAEVLLHGGAELEAGWLPPLLNNARNARILPGQPGNVPLSTAAQLLEVPTTPVDRSQGDVHPLGNPHFWLDPANVRAMADLVARTFARLDPAHAAGYTTRCKEFQDQLDRKMPVWAKAMESVRGTKIITYHKSYNYFAHTYGLEVAGEIEPKPGVEPSPTHIQSLIARTREAGVRFIVIEPFRPHRAADSLAAAIGARVLVLPEKVGSTDQARDVLTLLDTLVNAFTTAKP